MDVQWRHLCGRCVSPTWGPYFGTTRYIVSVFMEYSHSRVLVMHMPGNSQGLVRIERHKLVAYLRNASMARTTGCVRNLFTIRMLLGGVLNLLTSVFPRASVEVVQQTWIQNERWNGLRRDALR